MVKVSPLNVEKLYTISVLNLKYSNVEINQAIYGLFSKKVLFEDSKITKDSVLNNDTRNKIYEYVFNNPGAHLRDIQKNLDLSPHQTAWHLRMLEKFEYIRRKRFKNKITYFDFKINSELDNNILLLRDDKIFRILEYILLEPGINLNILAKKSKLKSQIVQDFLFNLQEIDLIKEVRENNDLIYFAKINEIEPFLRILKVPESKIEKYKKIGHEIQKNFEIENLIGNAAL